MVAACALWPAFAAFNDKATLNPKPAVLAAVPVTWSAAPSFSNWAPSYITPDARQSGVYQQSEGGLRLRPVKLDILYYRNQSPTKKLISSTNRLVGEKDAYHENGEAMRTEQVAGRSLVLRETRLQGPSGNLLVWHWMSIGGQPLTNAYKGKLLQAGRKLQFKGDDGAAIMVSSPYSDNQDDARAAMRAFLDAHLKAVEFSLERAGSN